MKKILIIIALILYIFQMVVLAIAIDTGTVVADGEQHGVNNYTYISGANAANATGVITKVDIYVYDAMTDCTIATFTQVDTNKFTARDSEAIGAQAVGEHLDISVNLDIVAGDFLGCYSSDGNLEHTWLAGGNRWYLLEDQTGCSETTFSNSTPRCLYIYGTGISYLWNTKVLVGWNGTVPNKWNGI